MNTASTRTCAALVDLRDLPLPERRPALLKAFETLPPGGQLEVQDDQAPLDYQMDLQAQWPGLVVWEPLQVDAQSWRVRMARREPGRSCCGCCGG
ncbi:MAG: DUF2249 domain-containing protein [Burkholderiales bacterium]|nr:DUF2249 domain-containing protein [Burkholderiales bacterium]